MNTLIKLLHEWSKTKSRIECRTFDGAFHLLDLDILDDEDAIVSQDAHGSVTVVPFNSIAWAKLNVLNVTTS